MDIKGNPQYWQITDFALKITEGMENASVHYNTVAKWFNTLEVKGIHYVNRAAGEKIYDELDLKIGRFIYELREAKWRLDVIFELVPEKVGKRDFPIESGEVSTALSTTDYEKLVNNITTKLEEKFLANQEKMKEAMEKAVEEIVTARLETATALIPAPKSEQEVRAERFNHAVLQMRVGLKLEEEAQKEWKMQPENIRLRKAGLFRKEENTEKKELFIRDYKAKNMEKALKEEIGIEVQNIPK